MAGGTVGQAVLASGGAPTSSGTGAQKKGLFSDRLASSQAIGVGLVPASAVPQLPTTYGPVASSAALFGNALNDTGAETPSTNPRKNPSNDSSGAAAASQARQGSCSGGCCGNSTNEWCGCGCGAQAKEATPEDLSRDLGVAGAVPEKNEPSAKESPEATV